MVFTRSFSTGNVTVDRTSQQICVGDCEVTGVKLINQSASGVVRAQIEDVNGNVLADLVANNLTLFNSISFRDDEGHGLVVDGGLFYSIDVTSNTARFFVYYKEPVG